MPFSAHKKLEAQIKMPNFGFEATATGITPTLEKATIFQTPKSAASGESKKRSAIPDQEAFKRSKSISEEPKAKIFQDETWD